MNLKPNLARVGQPDMGEGRVERARRGHPGASFWELAEAGRLPPITRDYVPRFIAVVRIGAGEHPCSAVLAPVTRRAALRGV